MAATPATAALNSTAASIPPLMLWGVSTGIAPDLLAWGFFVVLLAVANVETSAREKDGWRFWLAIITTLVIGSCVSAALAEFVASVGADWLVTKTSLAIHASALRVPAVIALALATVFLPELLRLGRRWLNSLHSGRADQ